MNEKCESGLCSCFELCEIFMNTVSTVWQRNSSIVSTGWKVTSLYPHAPLSVTELQTSLGKWLEQKGTF